MSVILPQEAPGLQSRKKKEIPELTAPGSAGLCSL